MNGGFIDSSAEDIGYRTVFTGKDAVEARLWEHRQNGETVYYAEGLHGTPVKVLPHPTQLGTYVAEGVKLG